MIRGAQVQDWYQQSLHILDCIEQIHQFFSMKVNQSLTWQLHGTSELWFQHCEYFFHPSCPLKAVLQSTGLPTNIALAPRARTQYPALHHHSRRHRLDCELFWLLLKVHHCVQEYMRERERRAVMAGGCGYCGCSWSGSLELVMRLVATSFSVKLLMTW